MCDLVCNSARISKSVIFVIDLTHIKLYYRTVLPRLQSRCWTDHTLLRVIYQLNPGATEKNLGKRAYYEIRGMQLPRLHFVRGSELRLGRRKGKRSILHFNVSTHFMAVTSLGRRAIKMALAKPRYKFVRRQLGLFTMSNDTVFTTLSRTTDEAACSSVGVELRQRG